MNDQAAPGCRIQSAHVRRPLVDIHEPIKQVQGGAEIIYYGGDIAELILAAALVTTWRPERSSNPVKIRHATAGRM